MAILSTDSLPLGFRFQPTDEELINHYLRLKINGRDDDVHVIPEIDIYKREPWDLPDLAVIKTADPEWFFFCPRHRKYPNGNRNNRATKAGYWKATGKDRKIESKKSGGVGGNMIGMKKSLVFHRGRAPKGERMNWIMHEYRATEKELDGTGPGQGAFVLCRLFRRSEDRIGVPKYDEVDNTGSSPATTRSSPDETSSDIVQEVGALEEKEPEGIKRWPTDISDKTDDPFAGTVDSFRSNLHSDFEENAIEQTPPEKYQLTGTNPEAYESSQYLLDANEFDSVEWPIQTDQPYFGSPLTNDFGTRYNEFQDGTGEQDIFLPELWDEVRNGVYCEESASQKHSAIGSESYLPDQICVSSYGQPDTYLSGNGVYGNKDDEMSRLQHDLVNGGPLGSNEQANGKSDMQIPAYLYHYQPDRSLYDGALEGTTQRPEPTSSAVHNGIFKSAESAHQMNSVNERSGTVIKIKSRQPRPQSNTPTQQGIASRRIRLQIPNTAEVLGETPKMEEETEVESSLSNVVLAAERSSCTSEPEVGSNADTESEDKGESCDSIPEQVSCSLRSRTKKGSQIHILENKASESAQVIAGIKGPRPLKALTAGVILFVMICLAVIVGLGRRYYFQ